MAFEPLLNVNASGFEFVLLAAAVRARDLARILAQHNALLLVDGAQASGKELAEGLSRVRDEEIHSIEIASFDNSTPPSLPECKVPLMSLMSLPPSIQGALPSSGLSEENVTRFFQACRVAELLWMD